jgi:hypothetical protein
MGMCLDHGAQELAAKVDAGPVVFRLGLWKGNAFHMNNVGNVGRAASDNFKVKLTTMLSAEYRTFLNIRWSPNWSLKMGFPGN